MSAQDESNASLSDHGNLGQVLQHRTPSRKTAEEKKEYLTRVIHETGIPADLTGIKRLKVYLHLIHIRTLLARCSVAQATIYELDRKPWTQDLKENILTYYEKMQEYALEAQIYAKELKSGELQARCEYWIGRGLGGAREWQAAAKHFALAIESDVSSDLIVDRRWRWKGLRPREKEDVRFLLEDTNRRSKEFIAKASAFNRAHAEVLSEHTGRKVVEELQEDATNNSTWLPERDRIVFIANKELALRRRLQTEFINADAEKVSQIEKEVEKNIKQKWEEKGATYMTKRVFNEEERCYIRHGTQWKKHRGYKGERICPTCVRHWVTKRRNGTDTSLSAASHISSLRRSPTNSVTLEHELEQTSWDSQRSASLRMQRTPSIRSSPCERASVNLSSTPSPSGTAGERDHLESLPSPLILSTEQPVVPPENQQETTFQKRRSASISSIRTSNISKQESVGQQAPGSPVREVKSARPRTPKIFDFPYQNRQSLQNTSPFYSFSSPLSWDSFRGAANSPVRPDALRRQSSCASVG